MSSASPIGVAGRPWGEQERIEWRAMQAKRRSYQADVVAKVEALRDRFERIAYGEIAYADSLYPLYALRSRVISSAMPNVLVTGGVHGYETSGVFGALAFLDEVAVAYTERINLLVAPCVSPWAYQRNNRWNSDAIDPNRNLRPDGPQEATRLIDLVHSFADVYLLHIDLHEST